MKIIESDNLRRQLYLEAPLGAKALLTQKIDINQSKSLIVTDAWDVH